MVVDFNIVSFVRLSTTLIWKLSPYSRRVRRSSHLDSRQIAYLVTRDKRTREDTVCEHCGTREAVGGNVRIRDGEVGHRPDSGRVTTKRVYDGGERAER